MAFGGLARRKPGFNRQPTWVTWILITLLTRSRSHDLLSIPEGHYPLNPRRPREGCLIF